MRIEPTLAVAEQFVELCAELVERGPIKEYVSHRATVASLRGRVDPAATLRGPWARGHRSVATCRWRQLTEDTEFNRLLLSASIRAERIIRSHRGVSRAARMLVVSLSGAQFVPHPPARLTAFGGDMSDMAGMARILIEGIPLSLTQRAGNEPLSAWINVERVFEEAVFEVCRSTLPTASVYPGARSGVQLFHAMSAEPPALKKAAEPDVVIDQSGKRLVLDAKYRRSGEYPEDPELYQLIAHAVAHGADAAALVTPALAAAPARRRLGRIATGCTVDVIAVDAATGSSVERGIREWINGHCAPPSAGVAEPGSGDSLASAR
jgi:5-methylcytosine-specific restriction endonuclease McrBC regulatory subunit McrC